MRTFFVLALCLGLVGCGANKPTAEVTTRLISAKTSSPLAKAAVSPASVAYGAVSFTPSRLRVPIYRISLLGTDSRATLYNCTAADCTVDLASDLAHFTELINASSSVGEGIYDRVQVMTCASGTGYSPSLAGSASLDGRTYRTSSSGVSTAAGSPEAVSVSFQGCGREYRLPSQLAVVPGQSLTLNLYVDIQNVAWFADPAAGSVAGISYLPSGCSGTADSSGHPPGAWVCMAYPDVAVSTGAATPTLERYLLVEGSGAISGTPSGAMFGLFFDAENRPLSGYTRRFFDPSARPNIGFMADTPVSSFSANPDGSYLLENYGESSPGGAPGPASFRAEAFKRMTHSAAYTVPRTSSSGSYSAKQMP